MNKIFFMVIIGILFINITSAEGDIGQVGQGECIDLYNYCPTCSWINLSSIQYPNKTVSNMNIGMVKTNNNYIYNFCDTDQLGQYSFTTCGDKAGVETCEDITFNVKNSNLIYFIILLSLASLFFIASLFVNEEFFVYISGVLFLIAGIYTMINGIDIVNDWYSRAIAYVTIGIGLLFTLGAYIYNSYSKWEEEEY